MNWNFFTRVLPRLLTQSPDWNKYKGSQAKEISGKVNKARAEQFAKNYIEWNFISICDELHVFEMACDWAKKSEFEKLAVADNIIRRFVERLKTNANTELVGKDGDMANAMPSKIYVARSSKGFMSVTTKGVVNINPDVMEYKTDLVTFLKHLRHEATHIVDMFFPDLSPLDADIRMRAMLFYMRPKENMDLYKTNPLELNANMRQDEFGDILRAKIALCEYNRVRGGCGNTMGGVLPGISRGR